MGADFGRGWPWRGPASLTRGLNVHTDQLKDVMVAAVTIFAVCWCMNDQRERAMRKGK